MPPLLAWAIHRSQQPTEYVITTSQFGQPLCTKRSRFLLTPLLCRHNLISPPVCNAFSPIKELKLKTCVPNASIIPWRYSHSLLCRIHRVTTISVSVSPNYYFHFTWFHTSEFPTVLNWSKSGISPLSAIRSRTNYLSDVCSYTVFSMGWLSHTHRNISKILGSFILRHVEHGKTHPIYGQFSISKRHCEDNNLRIKYRSSRNSYLWKCHRDCKK